MLRLLSWNALSLTAEGRAADLSGDTPNFNVLLIQGTQRRAFQDEVTTFRHSNHLEYSAGWERGPNTNRSCGCSVMVHNKYKMEEVKEIRTPPARLAGRAIMVRVKDRACEWALFSIYFPPKPCRGGLKVTYRNTVAALTGWLHSELERLPARVVPLIGTDLNDGLGMVKQLGVGWRQEDHTGFGRGAMERGDYAAMKFKEVLASHYLYAYNTRRWSGYTYFGTHGQRKVIDYVVGPASLCNQIAHCGTLGRLGSRHQLINTLDRRDHLPLGLGLPRATCLPVEA
eukprot:11171237-Lingulodinium_polyedra.AAC.1